jgi:hypothetical protein
VKESLLLSDGFDPFVWFELEGWGLLNGRCVWIKEERSNKETHVFDDTPSQVIRFAR